MLIGKFKPGLHKATGVKSQTHQRIINVCSPTAVCALVRRYDRSALFKLQLVRIETMVRSRSSNRVNQAVIVGRSH